MTRKTRARKTRSRQSRKAQRGGESNFKNKLEKLIEEERIKQQNLPKNYEYPNSPTELSKMYNKDEERFILMLRSLLSVTNTGKVAKYLKIKTTLHNYTCLSLFPISHDILTLIIFDRTTNELSDDFFNKIAVEFKNGYKIHTLAIDYLMDNNVNFFTNDNRCFFNFLLRNNNSDKATTFNEKAQIILGEFKWKVTSDN